MIGYKDIAAATNPVRSAIKAEKYISEKEILGKYYVRAETGWSGSRGVFFRRRARQRVYGLSRRLASLICLLIGLTTRDAAFALKNLDRRSALNMKVGPMALPKRSRFEQIKGGSQERICLAEPRTAFNGFDKKARLHSRRSSRMFLWKAGGNPRRLRNPDFRHVREERAGCGNVALRQRLHAIYAKITPVTAG